VIEDYFTPGWEIQRPTTQNVGGIAKDTYTPVVTIGGRMRSLTGSEIYANEKNNYKTSHRFYCGIHDIKPNDRIHDLILGLSYEVEFIRNPMSMDDHLEIDVLFEE
jgi:hypothetical protein